jgi:hypothetical protein
MKRLRTFFVCRRQSSDEVLNPHMRPRGLRRYKFFCTLDLLGRRFRGMSLHKRALSLFPCGNSLPIAINARHLINLSPVTPLFNFPFGVATRLIALSQGRLNVVSSPC